MMVCIIEGKLVIKTETEEESIEVTLKDHDTDKVIDLEFIEAQYLEFNQVGKTNALVGATDLINSINFRTKQNLYYLFGGSKNVICTKDNNIGEGSRSNKAI